MKTKIFFTSLVILIFLAFITPVHAESQNPVDTKVKTIASPDHNKLAEYYENEAKEMSLKVEEQKKLLHEYDIHSYYYGREGQDFQAHHEALLDKYEKAAERNSEMAAAHRKMAKKR
ncbi:MULTISPECIES: hypothetical protein [Nitrosomonas]|uniref:DUF4148 domain-containing protein n=1 Tax=Nitrosomonas communis TaxID=44574 RepID=A0A0F7KAV6_9PROT|nr:MULTISPECIES: hypothetical protein [Nitrosomonas]AKH36716.1 hypothetical protein AAW31_01020 [Nitrosomonas communis]TYP67967.1 hypothetical protein BCL69_11732 [Nitrosomonas communis]UVS61769.1 hypothetical protein NX761_01060 [Nitrosomonas sp. PLL12]